MSRKIKTIDLPLKKLQAHPLNSNVVPAATLAKLKRHIGESGCYPPVIVRPLAEGYQIIDGHHRVKILRELGHDRARCEIWPVDDKQALVLLGTLNRLSGEDDVHLRAKLVGELAGVFDRKKLEELLPDDGERIDRLLALNDEPPAVVPAPVPEDMPASLTFFLSLRERREVLQRLAKISSDRAEALLTVLQIREGSDVAAE